MRSYSDRIRVLHVDDEQPVLERSAEFLPRADDRIDVVTETCSKDGLRRLDEEPVDCVISAFDLGETSGLAFLDRVRERNAHLPFLLFAHPDSDATAAEAFAAGAADYVRQTGDDDQYDLLAHRVTSAIERVDGGGATRRSDTIEGYESLVEHAVESLCVFDETGRFTFVNRGSRSLLGHSPSELTGRRGIEYVHPEDRWVVLDAFERALDAPEETIAGAFRASTADDEWVRVETRLRNHLDEPAIDGVVAVSWRSSEHEGRERELHLFRQLLDHSTDEIYVIDPGSGRLIDVNETACERLGYSADELLQRRVVDIAAGIEEDDWPEHAATVRTEGGAVFLANHVRNDGSTYPVEVNVVHVESGDAEYMVSINRDLSDRRAQERELLRYRAIVESIDEALFMLAPDGTYAYLNEAAAANTTLSREEILGAHFTEVLDTGLLANEDRMDEFVELVEQLLRGERSTGQKMMEIQPPTGDRRVLDAELMEITSSQQGRLGIAGITRDITERVAYRQELERQNERLEEFAAVLSHDLRNPLNVADGRVTLAREECDSSHLEEASDAHRRIRTLIDDLLSLARNGGSIDQTETVAIGEVVERSWGMVETADADLRVEDDRLVSAHPSRLEQLFENLIRNAVEHGGRTVTVTVGALDDGFFVADDGRGIPPETRERVFQSGFTTSVDGTGFGLAIVDQIADAHGWNVRVTEGDRGGTRFEFTDVPSVGP